MPVFLDVDQNIDTPLEESSMAAHQGMPEIWQGVIEGRAV
jgi:hypothetical protein